MSLATLKKLADEWGCTVNQLKEVIAQVRTEVITELARDFEPQSMWDATRQLEREAYAKGVAKRRMK